jgi:beta-galactosidase
MFTLFFEHKKYSVSIKKQLLAAGVTVPLFTSDGSWLFQGGTIEGALPTANGEDDVTKLKKIVNQFNGGKGPYMVAEFYPGWLGHWAEPFPKVSKEEVVNQLKKYVDSSVSFNFYMVLGGTNFGFTTGANYDKSHDIQPDITSYDYDAPISEAGWVTDKYKAIRNLLLQQTKDSLPTIPDAMTIDIPFNAVFEILVENMGQRNCICKWPSSGSLLECWSTANPVFARSMVT